MLCVCLYCPESPCQAWNNDLKVRGVWIHLHFEKTRSLPSIDWALFEYSFNMLEIRFIHSDKGSDTIEWFCMLHTITFSPERSTKPQILCNVVLRELNMGMKLNSIWLEQLWLHFLFMMSGWIYRLFLEGIML